MTVEVPRLFVHWEAFLVWLLDHTEKFPKRLRPTLTHRIENLALDIFDLTVQARYSRSKQPHLAEMSQRLERLRLFLRIAHERRALDTRAFGYAREQIDEAGRMVGGWLRYAAREEARR